MPSGQIHDKITQGITVAYVTGLSILWWIYFRDIQNFFCLIFAYFGGTLGRIISPDLDNKIFFGNFLIRKSFGKIIEFIWQLYWTPYSIIPHRHWLSHSIVISTLIRLIYLLIPVITINYVFQLEIEKIITKYPNYCISFVIGLILADSGHIIADFMSTRRISRH